MARFFKTNEESGELRVFFEAVLSADKLSTAPMCITATLVDGYILSLTPFVPLTSICLEFGLSNV